MTEFEEDDDTCDFKAGCMFQGTKSEVEAHQKSCSTLENKKRHQEAEEKYQRVQQQLEVIERAVGSIPEKLAVIERALSEQRAFTAPAQAQDPRPAPAQDPRPILGTGSSSSSSSAIAAPPSFPHKDDDEVAKLKEIIRRMSEHSPGGMWSFKAPISSKRCFLSLVSHQNILYCFGGTTGNVVHEYLEVYDPNTKVWKNLIKMPTPRCGTTAVSLMDYVVCLGGVELKDGKQVLSTKLELYHPATGKWFVGSDMPTARAYFGAAVYDNKIFCFGGLGNDSMTMYNPVGNVWTDLGRLPRPRYAFSAIEYGGLIYLVGGSSTDENIKTVDRYDPVSRTFVNDGIIITIPGNWSSRGSAILNDKIYCLGGVSVDGIFTKTVDVYDMKERKWSVAADQPDPRSGFGVACLDGSIFCVGGRSGDATGSHDVETVTAFLPPA